MSSAGRFFDFTRRVAWATLVIVAIVSGAMAVGAWRLASATAGATPPRSGGLEWQAPASFAETEWLVFRSGATDGAAASSGKNESLAQRFRLAGTFVWMPNAGTVRRKAILDSLSSRQQLIVREGDQAEGADVLHIYDNSVVLRSEGREEQLWIQYTRAPSSTGSVGMAVGGMGADGRPLASSRFGNQVGETRWVMGRDKLMGYIQEMLENPVRMGKLFDSMVPVFDTNADGSRRVAGYRLQVVGEGDFYSATGLTEGDVVRRVNTMPISSKQRAMYWIDQFRSNRENAFVLDIERGGKPMRIEYLVH